MNNISSLLVPVGRLLFSAIFIMSGLNHFSPMMAGYAASMGVPMANIVVPITGIMILLGGISVLLGYKAKLGALLLIVFLVGVTPVMHAFWNIPDQMMRMTQMIMFMKNVSLLGASLMIFHFGSGPYSIKE
jgi:putative oxidoreductase